MLSGGALLAIYDRNMAIHDSVLVEGPCPSPLTLGSLAIVDLVLDPWAVLLVINDSIVFWSHQVTLFVPRAARAARAGRDGFRCASFIISIVDTHL